jgi:hypothetical protein
MTHVLDVIHRHEDLFRLLDSRRFVAAVQVRDGKVRLVLRNVPLANIVGVLGAT